MPNDPEDSSSKGPSPEEQKIYISIWAKTIDTQMHFNDMTVKARQLGLAFVTAVLGLGIALLTRDHDTKILVDVYVKFNLHVSVLIFLAAAGALWAMKYIDINIYHRMLRGAVMFGEDFERNYMRRIFDLRKV